MTGNEQTILNFEFLIMNFFTNLKLRIQNLKFAPSRRRRLGASGFTFIELLLVLAIMSLLASVVTAVAAQKIRQSKESALKEDLYILRKSVDDFYADTGKYPQQLRDLTDKRYMRAIPQDPFTESAVTWQVVLSREVGQENGIEDVHSGSEDKSDDGENYSDW
jgi:general secretion pathway protein G